MHPTFQLQHCPIFLGPLARAFPIWMEAQAYPQVVVLVDEHTRQYCLPYFLEQTGLVGKIILIEIASGEKAKNLATCENIWQAMLSAQIDRSALVINLGGGVIGDMGGFCAATWKRGVDFVQVPTTLLSMTDASIGGKTGIDFQGIKNTIGVFQQPAAVFADPYFLQTLPEREWRSGFAEVIKHALIGTPELMRQLSDGLRSNQPITSIDWLSVLQKSIQVKVSVVQEDPLEKGLRMILNFGHTIGHAIESWFLETDEPLTHGEAVYIGMICEAHFRPSKMAKRDLQSEIQSLGQSVFPFRNIPTVACSAIWTLMQEDKKKSSGMVRMAMPDEDPFSMLIFELTQTDVQRCLMFYNALAQDKV